MAHHVTAVAVQARAGQRSKTSSTASPPGATRPAEHRGRHGQRRLAPAVGQVRGAGRPGGPHQCPQAARLVVENWLPHLPVGHRPAAGARDHGLNQADEA
ncbi:hypothetical protein K1Y78_07015 [Streptomyces sp. tea 10]|nr:hypothetical protein [Streptomyces sp. tea 10]